MPQRFQLIYRRLICPIHTQIHDRPAHITGNFHCSRVHWSCFTTGWSGSSVDTPAGHPPLRGNGDTQASWPGWYVSPAMEKLRADVTRMEEEWLELEMLREEIEG